MNKMNQKPTRREKNAGFTLIELLVVVLIIGILAAIALPEYTKAVEKSRVSDAVTQLRNLLTAQKAYKLANAGYATDLTLLDIDMPNIKSDNPKHRGVIQILTAYCVKQYDNERRKYPPLIFIICHII